MLRCSLTSSRQTGWRTTISHLSSSLFLPSHHSSVMDDLSIRFAPTTKARSAIEEVVRDSQLSCPTKDTRFVVSTNVQVISPSQPKKILKHHPHPSNRNRIIPSVKEENAAYCTQVSQVIEDPHTIFAPAPIGTRSLPLHHRSGC